jgi:DNA-binding MarR family transcriptional regulator
MKDNRIDMEREALARFFQLSNKLQTFLDHQLKNDQLTAKQLFLMIVIGTFDTDPGFSKISERFGTSRQNVKQLALKLEKNGFVEIYTDETDSRYKRIKFTKKAIEYWKQRDELDLMMLNDMFKTISLEKMQVLQESMRVIDKNIDILNKDEEKDNENDN